MAVGFTQVGIHQTLHLKNSSDNACALAKVVGCFLKRLGLEVQDLPGDCQCVTRPEGAEGARARLVAEVKVAS